ncbi:MAG: AAA family ATPase [Cytophagaceae bacterium]
MAAAGGDEKQGPDMRRGLVIGKFMPPHKGHLALIEFGLQHSDELIVFLCYHAGEPIPGAQRGYWLRQLLKNKVKVIVQEHEFDQEKLSDSSQASWEESKKWSSVIKKLFPDLSVVFSSEAYGAYLAHFLCVEHVAYDESRKYFPVSASQIRKNPVLFWDYLPSLVQPWFVQKICLLGTESTGKSTLVLRLADHYHTVYVPEMAREVIGHTNECRPEDLLEIARRQAEKIREQAHKANRFLFIDTDLNITRSYAQFLFGAALEVPRWIEEANQCQLYLYLDPDCPYVQDGTRLTGKERLLLDASHKEQLKSNQINCRLINGDWEERFSLVCSIIEQSYSMG